MDELFNYLHMHEVINRIFNDFSFFFCRVALKFICIGKVQLKLYWHLVLDTLIQMAACNPLKRRRLEEVRTTF